MIDSLHCRATLSPEYDQLVLNAVQDGSWTELVTRTNEGEYIKYSSMLVMSRVVDQPRGTFVRLREQHDKHSRDIVPAFLYIIHRPGSIFLDMVSPSKIEIEVVCHFSQLLTFYEMVDLPLGTIPLKVIKTLFRRCLADLLPEAVEELVPAIATALETDSSCWKQLDVYTDVQSTQPPYLMIDRMQELPRYSLSINRLKKYRSAYLGMQSGNRTIKWYLKNPSLVSYGYNLEGMKKVFIYRAEVKMGRREINTTVGDSDVNIYELAYTMHDYYFSGVVREWFDLSESRAKEFEFSDILPLVKEVSGRSTLRDLGYIAVALNMEPHQVEELGLHSRSARRWRHNSIKALKALPAPSRLAGLTDAICQAAENARDQTTSIGTVYEYRVA